MRAGRPGRRRAAEERGGARLDRDLEGGTALFMRAVYGHPFQLSQRSVNGVLADAGALLRRIMGVADRLSERRLLQALANAVRWRRPAQGLVSAMPVVLARAWRCATPHASMTTVHAACISENATSSLRRMNSENGLGRIEAHHGSAHRGRLLLISSNAAAPNTRASLAAWTGPTPRMVPVLCRTATVPAILAA